MTAEESRKENQLLSKLSFITTLGDFLSMFALMQLLYNLTGRVELAALAVTVKSFAYVLSSLVFPSLTNHFNLKTLIVGTQVICSLVMAFICYFAPGWAEQDSMWLLVLLAVQALLKRIFENSRESYSKNLRTETTHRSFQAELLHGFYKAQFLGPIISLGLIYYLPIQIPLFIDSLTFLLAAGLALSLKQKESREIRKHLLKPLKYLHKTPGLLSIFLLRSVAYWIPVGIFNYMLFGIVKEHYGLKLVQSAWVYAAIGMGSLMASYLLKDSKTKKLTWLGKLPNGPLAAGALIVLALTRVAFLSLPSFAIAMGVLVISGVCNGLNATATQALRSRLCTKAQFPEVVALEQIVGRTTDFLIQSFCLWAIASNLLDFTDGVWISAGLLIIVALLHLKKSLWIHETTQS